jgi:TolB-like protein/DNA-binding winged helix-turn-helix (wHTH) protein
LVLFISTHRNAAYPVMATICGWRPRSSKRWCCSLKPTASLVEKDDLMKALWPDTFVEEVTLSRNISLLRKALGDTPGQDQSEYIETVSKRGYRFIAPVTERKGPYADQSRVGSDSSVDCAPTPAIPSSTQALREKQPKQLGRAPWFLLGAIAVGASIAVIAWVSFRALRVDSPRSIAVLPFVDESQNASSEYIADGITEGVIFKLSEIPGLRVISRSSVFRFKGKETDAQAVGKDLKVDAVLSGRIEHQTDGVTISVELVNVRDGSQIWGGRFKYPISDLARAQDDLAAAISGQLRLRLSSEDHTRLATLATANPEAYQLYLQARFHWNQRTPIGIKKSIDLFQLATERDANFALAYAGLADAYNMANNLGVLSAKECMPEAKAAATKALVLDPRLAEAHAALGLVKSHYDFDFPCAEGVPESYRTKSQLRVRACLLCRRISDADAQAFGSNRRSEESYRTRRAFDAHQ